MFELRANEGDSLEQSVHQVLESLYGESAHRSPEIKHGTNRRELTDTLIVANHYMCLFESKALSVIHYDLPGDYGRVLKRTKKDIDQGLRQLKGAVRRLRAGDAVNTGRHRITGTYLPTAKAIKLPDRDCCILAFIVLSDMNVDLEWEEISRILAEESSGNTVYQVIDLDQLRWLVGTATDSDQFLTNGVLRFQKVLECGNCSVRVRIWREGGLSSTVRCPAR